MVPVSAFVDLLLSQEGDEYIFGHEVSPSDSDPDAFDCSELVEWGCARLGITPRMPDGSWNQATHCRNNGDLISINGGIDTYGALLFRFSSDPFSGTRPSSAHVAVSLGDGSTIEARGTAYGVGSWSALDRGWTHAALIPGIDYEEEDMPQFTEAEVKLLRDLVNSTLAVESNGTFPQFVIPQFREWARGDDSLENRLARLEANNPDNPDLVTLRLEVDALEERVASLEDFDQQIRNL